MHSQKEFLSQECDNIHKLLRDALRFDYGEGGSETFFVECTRRLEYVRNTLDSCGESDTTELAEMAGHISRLSLLIAKIERSHIGEFSWAFGNAFKRHAQKICAERSSDDSPTSSNAGDPILVDGNDPRQPLFFIIAEGGLSAYAVRPEQNYGVYDRRIFTIAVPRSLRHHVMLHPILGHEVGHAMQFVPTQRPFIEYDLIDFIREGSKLASEDGFRQLDLRPRLDRRTPTELRTIRKAWLTEIACDLLGLAFMGPSFLGAAQALLGAIDGEGGRYGPKHPPNAWRFEALLRAFRSLGWDTPPSSPQPLVDAHNRMVADFATFDRRAGQADEIFGDGVIEEAVDRIVKFLNSYAGNLSYRPPSPEELGSLLNSLCQARPPLGQDFKSGNWRFLDIDYRHILHAGWLATATPSDESIPIVNRDRFFYLNRLCEQAIVQREALFARRQKP